MRLLKWLLIAIGAVVVLAVGGTFVYINFIRDDPPPPLSFAERDAAESDPSTTVPTEEPADDPVVTTEGVDGTWSISDGSEAGYRAKEILLGQDSEAVGRTTGVTGGITIEGTTVTQGSFTVDMTTVESDEDRRDNQFQGRIMDTSTYPTAEFTLTAPLDFGALPAEGATITVPATGSLTLRGVTNEVTFDVEARINAGDIEIVGSIDVHFDDYEIPEPSAGPAQVGDDGTVEFLLVLARSA